MYIARFVNTEAIACVGNILTVVGALGLIIFFWSLAIIQYFLPHGILLLLSSLSFPSQLEGGVML